MKIHVIPPSQLQPNSPSSKEYSTKHLLETSQAPGPILLKKSCKQKIKKQQQWKKISQCMPLYLISTYFKIRGLGHSCLVLAVRCLLQWQCSASLADIAGEQRDPLGVNKDCSTPPISWASLHLTGMERVPTPSHPPHMSPTGFCLFPRPAEHTAVENLWNEQAHRTDNLICCYGNLGLFAQHRIKPVSIPRASGAVFDLEIALPNLLRSEGQSCYCTIIPISCLTVPLYVLLLWTKPLHTVIFPSPKISPMITLTTKKVKESPSFGRVMKFHDC